MERNQLFAITVNGVEIKTRHEKLVPEDILNLAAENGAISGDSGGYVLVSEEPEREFKNGEWVDFSEHKEFIAEKTGPTPVAAV